MQNVAAAIVIRSVGVFACRASLCKTRNVSGESHKLSPVSKSDIRYNGHPSSHLSWTFANTPIFSSTPATPFSPTNGKPERLPALDHPGYAVNMTSPPVTEAGMDVSTRSIQTKLNISQPGDLLERDADEAAATVMRMPDGPLAAHGSPERSPILLDSIGSELQGRGQQQSNTPSDFSGALGETPAPQIVHHVLNSPGQALDVQARTFMEARFGHYFGNIRVHTGAAAAESARSIHARAYTVGDHIVFGPSTYAPDTTEGRSLLAHELAHTLQQRASRGSASGPFALVQRDPDTRRPRGGPFATADQFVLPDVPGLNLPTKSEKNLVQVTINDLDTNQTKRTTIDAVLSSPQYVDNGVVSVGAEIENLMYLRIKALNYRYRNKPDALIPISAIDLSSVEMAFDFFKYNGVIYPVSADGEVILNDTNTPNLVRGARTKLADRSDLLAEREQIAWTVYAFAGAVAQLGGYASQMGSIHSLGFSIGKSLPSRKPTAGTGAVPDLSMSGGKTNEISTLTNLPHDVPAATALQKYTVGSGFSGVYDPKSKSFVALASGKNTRLLSGKPVSTVDQLGGHADAEAALIAKLGNTDATKHIGFAIVWKGNDTVEVKWNSGIVNFRNFGNRAAPVSERASIVTAIETTLGVKVVQ